MNKKLALLATSVVMLAASAVTAENQWGFTPYVGADAQWRHMNFNGGLGDNLFKHDYPQGNVFAGIKLNDYIGVEVGYESTVRKTRTTFLNAGEIPAGAVIPAGYSFQYTSTAQVKGPHANLIGSFPISEEYRLKMIGLVGVAQLKVNLVSNMIHAYDSQIVNNIGTNEIPVASFPTSSTMPVFAKRKSLLRLGGGLEHMFCENWGVRATVIWENTNKLTAFGNPPPPGLQTPRKVKENNSVAYGLGVFVTF